jgi:hypothetical protein
VQRLSVERPRRDDASHRHQLWATLNKSLARRASRLRAVCFVPNPRHSFGYGCGLRLASHPAAGRAPSRELIQRCLCC